MVLARNSFSKQSKHVSSLKLLKSGIRLVAVVGAVWGIRDGCLQPNTAVEDKSRSVRNSEQLTLRSSKLDEVAPMADV